jgi:MoxR-like ATPase
MFAGDGMAEDLLGGILRDDEEALAVRATEALAGPETVAAAIADRASSQNLEVARQLAVLLGKQAQLLETHAEHLKYHHPLRLEYLCNKVREERPGLPTHSFLVRRLPLKFSPRVVNDQHRVCRDDT